MYADILKLCKKCGKASRKERNCWKNINCKTRKKMGHPPNRYLDNKDKDKKQDTKYIVKKEKSLVLHFSCFASLPAVRGDVYHFSGSSLKPSPEFKFFWIF